MPRIKRTSKRAASCHPGSKKFAKLVRGNDGRTHCVRYGDPNMTIKKHIPERKRSYCRRHRCDAKTDPATPGYQSCLAWNCAMRSQGSAHRRAAAPSRRARRGTTQPRAPRAPRTKTQRKARKRTQERRAAMARSRISKKRASRKKAHVS